MSASTTTTGRAAQAAAHEQEALMGRAVPSQHPAVVLRSHFNQLRALLAVALIAVISLTVAVVILASDEDQTGGSNSAAPIGHLNNSRLYNPATGRPYAAPLPKREAQTPITGSRYDGVPEEGTRGIRHSSAAPGAGSPQASETPGTVAAQKQVEIGRSITDPDEYLAFVKSLADYGHAREYGNKR
jgi:hypothetical protein